MPKLRFLSVLALTFSVAACATSQISSTVTGAPKASAPVDDPHKPGNPPRLSAGSGKDLGDLKSGLYKMTSAGLDRQYTIDIPTNYDKHTPYRLIFAMHPMNNHMANMVSGKFYDMKTFAERDHIPVIFVAPEGYTDNSPWRIRDDKDHAFFDDMLALFKDKLSIDTTRIFCTGFSYGAMVTYSLSLDHQKDLRAVACFSPANWNIYLPTNTHQPIPYFQTTGTNDPTCKWINSDDRQQGGKYCVLGHLTDNGFNTLMLNGSATLPEIPLATSPTHVTTEFKGTKENYPVVFGSFVGAHTDSHRDPGTRENWIHKEAWEFFKRF